MEEDNRATFDYNENGELSGVDCCVDLDEEGNILLGEKLFLELCWTWIEKKGPGILRMVCREFDREKGLKPSLKKEKAFYEKD